VTEERPKSVPERLEDHLGLAIAAVGILLVALRLLAVAEFHTDTALAVLQISGTAEIAVGTLMTLLPLMAMLGLGLLCITLLTFEGSRAWLAALIGAAVVVAIAVSFASYGPLIDGMYVAMVPVALVARWFLMRGTRPPALTSSSGPAMRGLLVVAAVILLVTVALGPSVWLPAETVMADGKPYAGYVLASDSDGAALLLDGTRRVVHVGPITRRVLCRPPRRKDERSLAAAVGLEGRPRYPVCHPSLVS